MDVRWHSWGREEAARLVSELDDAVSRNCAVRRQAVADIVDQLVRQKMKVKVVRSASAARSLGAVLTVLLRGVGDESGLCTRLGAAIVVCDPGVANPQSAVLATLCRQQSQDNNKYTFRLGHAVKLLLPGIIQVSRAPSHTCFGTDLLQLCSHVTQGLLALSLIHVKGGSGDPPPGTAGLRQEGDESITITAFTLQGLDNIPALQAQLQETVLHVSACCKPGVGDMCTALDQLRQAIHKVECTCILFQRDEDDKIPGTLAPATLTHNLIDSNQLHPIVTGLKAKAGTSGLIQPHNLLSDTLLSVTASKVVLPSCTSVHRCLEQIGYSGSSTYNMAFVLPMEGCVFERFRCFLSKLCNTSDLNEQSVLYASKVLEDLAATITLTDLSASTDSVGEEEEEAAAAVNFNDGQEKMDGDIRKDTDGEKRASIIAVNILGLCWTQLRLVCSASCVSVCDVVMRQAGLVTQLLPQSTGPAFFHSYCCGRRQDDARLIEEHQGTGTTPVKRRRTGSGKAEQLVMHTLPPPTMVKVQANTISKELAPFFSPPQHFSANSVEGRSLFFPDMNSLADAILGAISGAVLLSPDFSSLVSHALAKQGHLLAITARFNFVHALKSTLLQGFTCGTRCVNLDHLVALVVDTVKLAPINTSWWGEHLFDSELCDALVQPCLRHHSACWAALGQLCHQLPACAKHASSHLSARLAWLVCRPQCALPEGGGGGGGGEGGGGGALECFYILWPQERAALTVKTKKKSHAAMKEQPLSPCLLTKFSVSFPQWLTWEMAHPLAEGPQSNSASPSMLQNRVYYRTCLQQVFLRLSVANCGSKDQSSCLQEGSRVISCLIVMVSGIITYHSGGGGGDRLKQVVGCNGSGDITPLSRSGLQVSGALLNSYRELCSLAGFYLEHSATTGFMWLHNSVHQALSSGPSSTTKKCNHSALVAAQLLRCAPPSCICPLSELDPTASVAQALASMSSLICLPTVYQHPTTLAALLLSAGELHNRLCLMGSGLQEHTMQWFHSLADCTDNGLTDSAYSKPALEAIFSVVRESDLIMLELACRGMWHAHKAFECFPECHLIEIQCQNVVPFAVKRSRKGQPVRRSQ